MNSVLAHRRYCRAGRGAHRLPGRHAARGKARAESSNGELEADARLSSEIDLRRAPRNCSRRARRRCAPRSRSASRLALDANSETFLKLAREVFRARSGGGRRRARETRKSHQPNSLSRIHKALAKQEEQAQAMERERRESSRQVIRPDRKPGQRAGPAAARNPQSIHGAASSRSARPMGRDHVASRGRTRRYVRPLRLRRAGERRDQRPQRGSAPRPAGAHARFAQHRGRCQDAARCLHGRQSKHRTTNRAALALARHAHAGGTARARARPEKLLGTVRSTVPNSPCCSCQAINSCPRRWRSDPTC